MNDFLLYHHFSLFGKQFTYGDALVILVLLAIIIWQVSIDVRWDKHITKIIDEEKLKERKWFFMATAIFTVAFYALGLGLGKFNSTLR